MNELKGIERGNGNIFCRKGNEQEAAATLERLHATAGSTCAGPSPTPAQDPLH